ncbi:hypothetical protein CRUP_029988 [Coryphaenoides rupestris]|nr:hypothetical protein CRUP_029988 [Coryphaenoides rupestris]
MASYARSHAHTPDNSLMGFAVKQEVRMENRKENMAGKADYIQVLSSELEVHATVFVGLGFPYEGPAPLEALSLGCVFLQPNLIPPHSPHSSPFYRGKPTTREISSQHPYAEHFVGKPYVWTVDVTNRTALRQAIKDIKLMQLKPFTPTEFTCAGMLERLQAYITHQGEPLLFSCAGSDPQLRRLCPCRTHLPGQGSTRAAPGHHQCTTRAAPGQHQGQAPRAPPGHHQGSTGTQGTNQGTTRAAPGHHRDTRAAPGHHQGSHRAHQGSHQQGTSRAAPGHQQGGTRAQQGTSRAPPGHHQGTAIYKKRQCSRGLLDRKKKISNLLFKLKLWFLQWELAVFQSKMENQGLGTPSTSQKHVEQREAAGIRSEEETVALARVEPVLVVVPDGGGAGGGVTLPVVNHDPHGHSFSPQRERRKLHFLWLAGSVSGPWALHGSANTTRHTAIHLATITVLENLSEGQGSPQVVRLIWGPRGGGGGGDFHDNQNKILGVLDLPAPCRQQQQWRGAPPPGPAAPPASDPPPITRKRLLIWILGHLHARSFMWIHRTLSPRFRGSPRLLYTDTTITENLAQSPTVEFRGPLLLLLLLLLRLLGGALATATD